ncbi:MAG: class I adenylate-forming enzyme family protein [Proteobacteria bacterium]|nr:class I adenylate-forming enzyme family protein [Pseudomonadota bacterium]
MTQATSSMTWKEAVAAVTAPGQRFALGEAEIDGRVVTVFENTPPSLRAVFAAARSHPGDFLVYEDERWSFAEVMSRADEIATLLVDRYGVRPGDRVAIAMRNYPEWIVSFAAITSVGAIAVSMNAWWTADEMVYGLEDSGATVLIGDRERVERAAPAMERLGLRALSVRADTVPEGVDRLEDHRIPGATMPDVEVGPDDDAIILYTSGTTGHPKGAVSTHRAVLSALMAFGCRTAVTRLMSPPKEEHPFPVSFILVVPLFHVTGLIPVMMSCFATGYKLVMMYKWSPERALEHIETEKITTFVGVPTQSWDLLESPDFARRNTESVLSVGGGGAPAPPELIQRIEKGFERGRPGIGYGMTETNAFGPGISGDEILARPRSCGRAIVPMEIKVADDEAREVPCGEIGEIWFYGPTLIRGYWNNPEATAETIVDGWLRSGDLGRMDDEGFLYIEDRAKDMVLRAGENVYSAEVEAAIYEYPAVYEAAVFGLPHERLGEEVACAILPKPGMQIDVGELQAHLRQRLAPFKIPSVVEIADEPLPRNPAGKFLKREIRDAVSARHGRA